MGGYDLWGRLRYMLSPQFDIYEKVAEKVRGYVADIGCGTGFGTHLLTRNAKMVHGYEIDDNALRFADRVFSNGNLAFYKGSITGEMSGRNHYEVVTMIDVIEHIKEDALAIQNCKRQLVTGGTLICSTPNKLSRYKKSDYHVREYTPQGLKALLSRSFNDVEIMNFELNPIESDYENPMIGVCK